jgi:UDP-N-acetylmuramoylalanine-D-glutamate ligase
VTNITPNHLDQFSWDEYVGLKRNILLHQHRGDTAILNADDHTSRALMASIPADAWCGLPSTPSRLPTVRGSMARTSLCAAAIA